MPTSTEQECDKLIKQLGGRVIPFGRKGKRTMNAQGVPDRVYLVKGRVIWFECKSPNDYLSPAQILLLTDVQVNGGIAGCGNAEDLTVLLNSPNSLRTGREQITKYSTRQKALRGVPLSRPIP